MSKQDNHMSEHDPDRGDDDDRKPEPLYVCGTGPASGPPGSVAGEEMTDDGKCPRCGAEPCSGYGLAFGGMGVYHYCSNGDCEWFYKIQDSEE